MGEPGVPVLCSAPPLDVEFLQTPLGVSMSHAKFATLLSYHDPSSLVFPRAD